MLGRAKEPTSVAKRANIGAKTQRLDERAHGAHGGHMGPFGLLLSTKGSLGRTSPFTFQRFTSPVREHRAGDAPLAWNAERFDRVGEGGTIAVAEERRCPGCW